MRKEFKEHAAFVTVYVLEAHASDEWPMGTEICFRQPKTLEQRLSVAQAFIEDKKIGVATVGGFNG
eukprot:m.208746 g.208746  ORF g.208746 m.208746 type:complete len:66 (+) comp15810_c0_seq19:3466-3663(+)